ncbi:MAG: hypothetical protein GY929_15045 [Actinomycetia bacterium]|nr:hypothetical protein [Actinomycetes bacterium]
MDAAPPPSETEVTAGPSLRVLLVLAAMTLAVIGAVGLRWATSRDTAPEGQPPVAAPVVYLPPLGSKVEHAAFFEVALDEVRHFAVAGEERMAGGWEGLLWVVSFPSSPAADLHGQVFDHPAGPMASDTPGSFDQIRGGWWLSAHAHFVSGRNPASTVVDLADAISLDSNGVPSINLDPLTTIASATVEPGRSWVASFDVDGYTLGIAPFPEGVPPPDAAIFEAFTLRGHPAAWVVSPTGAIHLEWYPEPGVVVHIEPRGDDPSREGMLDVANGLRAVDEVTFIATAQPDS